MTTRLPRICLGLTVTGLLLTAGCGASRPSATDLESGLVADTSLFPVAGQHAECAAEKLRDSDLSDETLTAIAEVDDDHEIPAEEQSLLATIQVAVLTDCTD